MTQRFVCNLLVQRCCKLQQIPKLPRCCRHGNYRLVRKWSTASFLCRVVWTGAGNLESLTVTACNLLDTLACITPPHVQQHQGSNMKTPSGPQDTQNREVRAMTLLDPSLFSMSICRSWLSSAIPVHCHLLLNHAIFQHTCVSLHGVLRQLCLLWKHIHNQHNLLHCRIFCTLLKHSSKPLSTA